MPVAEHHRISKSARRRRVVLAALVLAAVVIGFVAWAFSWYEGEVSPGPRGPAVIVEVAQGASVGAISATLSDKEVIGSDLAFRLYLFLHGTPDVQPGRYLLYRNEGFGDVRSVLAGGPDVFALDVPAGFTVAEVARAVGTLPGHSSSAFLSTAESGAVPSPYLARTAGHYNLDGLLGAGSYTILPGETDAQLLRQMVGRFDTQAAALDLDGGSAALGHTSYDVITVASIIQKEAMSPGDSAAATDYNAPRVSRVIYNRLAAGMPLQDNSTVLYAEGRDGGPFTNSDLDYDSPYNTYEHSGLTPSPICFPSTLALQAALHPMPGNWMYFVLTSSDGTETFSVTYGEQQAAENLAKQRGLP